MKKLDLNEYGVQEMNAEEMRETEGGFIPILIGLGVGLTISFCNNFGEFVSGYKMTTLK